MIHIPQELVPVTLHDPNEAPTGDGRAVSVGDYQAAYVVVNSVQAAATGIQIIPERNDAAGTGWLAFANNVRIWSNEDTTDGAALSRENDAANFTQAASADAMQTVLQINLDSLGLHTTAPNNPCTQFRVRLVQGNVGDVASVVAYLVPRYGG